MINKGISIFLPRNTDVSTWADEVRNAPEYRYTAPWHFVNVPSGLTYKQFSAEAERQGDNNLYAAIINSRSKLFSGTPAEKVIALKFLVHLVGDTHQPMHVSHKEDKGGNNIQVQFMGRGTNLHSLWDSGLIDYQKSSYGALATEFDTAAPEQIKQWQNDDFMQWLWESYQISSKLYQELESGNKLDERYYMDHIGMVQQRVDMAGIRLAYILNECLSGGLNPTIKTLPDVIESAPQYKTIKLEEINRHIGETVTVSSRVTGTKVFENMVLVNMGGAYPNQMLTIVLKGDLIEFGKSCDGKLVGVRGRVILYQGKPEIVVTDPELISVRKTAILN